MMMLMMSGHARSRTLSSSTYEHSSQLSYLGSLPMFVLAAIDSSAISNDSYIPNSDSTPKANSRYSHFTALGRVEAESDKTKTQVTDDG